MRTQYITDIDGKRVGVVLPVREYERMLEEIEELADIRAYDRAKARKSEPVPFDEAIKEIEFFRNANL